MLGAQQTMEYLGTPNAMLRNNYNIYDNVYRMIARWYLSITIIFVDSGKWSPSYTHMHTYTQREFKVCVEYWKCLENILYFVSSKAAETLVDRLKTCTHTHTNKRKHTHAWACAYVSVSVFCYRVSLKPPLVTLFM